jgi:hypothetical protein
VFLRGLYIGKYPPMSFGWEKNMKKVREKGGKCKRKMKGKKGERKIENGKYG